MTLTEVDEIDPHCGVVNDKKFVNAAAEFLDVVDLASSWRDMTNPDADSKIPEAMTKPCEALIQDFNQINDILRANSEAEFQKMDECI